MNIAGFYLPRFPGTERVPLFAKIGNRSLYKQHRKIPVSTETGLGPSRDC